MAGATARWQDAAYWQRLPGAPTQCAPRAAFVSILSGPAYVPQAACLAMQLREVGKVCPHILVHDDRPEIRLADHDLHTLALAHGGHARLYPSSWLFAQAHPPGHAPPTPW